MTKAKTEEGWKEGCGCLFVIAVIAAISWGAYDGLDSLGWIPHNEETAITAQSSWLVGESKECVSYPPFNQAEAYPLGKPVGYAVALIKCDDGPEHRIKIRFFGRIEQPEYAAVRWKCTRGEDGFTCYELGGIRTEK
jgi:hypothetical protein